MDVWRYSDWYGRRYVNDVRNSFPHIWRWRDWIIHSLNTDKGYDDMVREMLAADESSPENDETVVATGFIVRNWYSLNYDQWMRDLVEHTGKAFLGLRTNCALCHDHKYDPLTQEEYFKFRAFFEPLEVRHDRVPGGPALPKLVRYTPGSGASLSPTPAGLARVYEETLDAPTFMYSMGDQRLRMDRPAVTPGTPAFLGGDPLDIRPVQMPPVAWYPGLKPFAQQAELDQRRAAMSDAESKATAARTALAQHVITDDAAAKQHGTRPSLMHISPARQRTWRRSRPASRPTACDISVRKETQSLWRMSHHARNASTHSHPQKRSWRPLRKRWPTPALRSRPLLSQPPN